MSTMRAKMRVASVEKNAGGSEDLTFSAVSKSEGYPDDGSDENNSFARFTPMAELSMTIQNPDLIGKFAVDDEYYLDFTRAE